MPGLDKLRPKGSGVAPTYKGPNSSSRRRRRSPLKLSMAALNLSGIDELYCERTSILSSVPFLSPSDRARFALFGVGPHRSVPFECIHHAFTSQVAACPHAIAAEHLESNITYRHLDMLSDTLARTLRSRGIGPGFRVCLLVQRSIAMVVGILAILKAGASYIPLDGGIVTDETLHYILSDSNAQFMVYLSEFHHRIPSGMDSICLDTFMGKSADLSSTKSPISDVSLSSHEAYVIYTSGTTGKPKGVSITHANVTNLLCLSPGNLHMKPGARVSQIMNVAFDMCAWEVLGSLINGCTLCIRGKSKADWETVLRTVDIVIATPTILRSYSPLEFPNIKCVATAGEPCPQSLADSWSRVADFYNSCGPTETTIVNTMQLHRTGSPISIGCPTPNNIVYILDELLRPVPIGEVGTMWAAGAGVCNGYLNRPDLNREKFTKDPFVNDGSLMFNTGDLGRWNKTGTLEHLGRVDDQVKIKGFRVELDGVAAAMQTCQPVNQAASLLIGEKLWGFYSPSNVSVESVRSATSRQLSYYAVPSEFMALDELPTTSNGKIDKAKLRAFAKGGIRPNLVLDTTGSSISEKISIDFRISWNNKSPLQLLASWLLPWINGLSHSPF